MKVLIVPSALEEVDVAARYLASRLVISGIDALVHDSHGPDQLTVSADELALVVCMGGDGTFLRAAHLIDFAPVPMLALNYGTLAFLAGNPDRDDVELITSALSGDMLFEHRSIADIEITQADGRIIRNKALNEVAYTRGRSGRVVEYRYGINGITIARLKADGLVVATPTGSTGYALSAGSPIVSPVYTGLVVVPVAPHALNTRAIVLAPSDVLEVIMDTTRSRDASIFVDGTMLDVDEPVSIEVRRGDHDLLLARGGDAFFRNVSRVFFGGPYPDMPDRR